MPVVPSSIILQDREDRGVSFHGLAKEVSRGVRWFGRPTARCGKCTQGGLEVGTHAKCVKVIRVYSGELFRRDRFTLGMFPGKVGLPDAKDGFCTGWDWTALVVGPGGWITEGLNVPFRDPLQESNMNVITVVKERLV